MKTTSRILIIISLLLLVAVSIHAKPKKKTPVVVEKTALELAIENIKAAENAYEDVDFDTAIAKYTTAIDCLKKAEPTASPEDDIPKQIFRIKMNVAKIHNDFAFDFFSQNDFDEALSHYESSMNIYKSIIAESTPQDSVSVYINRLYRNSAICSRKAGEFQKALDYYDLFLEANPEDDDILLQKFAIYKEDLKDENMAFEVLKEYALNKNDFNACHRLGDLYRDKNDLDNAVIWYNKALTIKEDSNIIQKLGSIYRSKTQWANSTQMLEKFILTNPEREALNSAYKLIADNYKNLGNKPKAAEYFLKSLELEYNEDIAIYLCSFYNENNNNDKILQYANLVLSNNPNNSTALLFRGIAKFNKKDTKGAKVDFERIKNDPKHGKTAQQYLNLIK